MKHAVKHLGFPKPTVKTVAEFRQVAGQMLGADAVVDTPDVTFNISDQGVDPGQDLWDLLPRTGHQPLMTDTGRSIQEAIASPAIGLDHRLGRQALPDTGLRISALLMANDALIKVGARVSYHARRWYVHIASAFPLDHRYRTVLAWGS